MKIFVLVWVAQLCGVVGGWAVPLVTHGEVWHYRKGTSAPQGDWKTASDAALDGSWLTGPGWIGYGDGTGSNEAGTTLTDMRQVTGGSAGYRTFYMRRTFTVPAGAAATDEVVLEADFDDGFVAWIDGTEVDRLNVPGAPAEPAWNTTGAVSNRECSFGDGTAQPVRTTVLGTVGAAFPPGTYTLSAMLVNTNLTSSDAVLKLNLFTRAPVAPLDLHWELAESPIILTTTFAVTAGQTLLIDPGVEVRCPGGVDAIACAGKIVAAGTEAAPIRFVRAAAGTPWRRIVVSGTEESVFTWCDFDGANTSGTIRGDGTSSASPAVRLERCRFLNTEVQMVDLTWTSCRLLFCEFDSIGAQELLHFSNMPAAGHALIQGCRFGLPGVPPSSGYNDIIDFTGGNRPGPIGQFLDNVFLASVDDCFDMDGTDAHIEGNIFLNVAKDAARSSSSNPITTGANGSDRSELVICRNLFYNCEHLFMEKDLGTGILQHNTIVRVRANPLSNNTSAGGNEGSGVIMFGEPWRGAAYGDGAIFDGNIATEIEAGVTDLWPCLTGASAEAGFFFLRRNNCLTGFPQAGAGNTGNLVADPMLVGVTGVDHTNIRSKFALQVGSPCRGTGPLGLDMGALVPSGAHISGAPLGVTASRSATLQIGGPGVWAYRWRLNGGAWSADVPLVGASILSGSPFRADMFDNATPVSLTNLPDGVQVVEVLGRSSAGTWQTTPAAVSWTVQTPPPDADEDGMPDAWEITYNLNPNDATDAATDRDGDTQSNLAEYVAGTDPTDAMSRFLATSTTAGGQLSLSFPVVAGKSYRILSTLDFIEPWTVRQVYPVQTAAGILTWVDQDSTSARRTFYKVQTP